MSRLHNGHGDSGARTSHRSCGLLRCPPTRFIRFGSSGWNVSRSPCRINRHRWGSIEMSAELPSTGATRDSLGERRSPQEIRRRCELLFERAGVQFAPYEHEPVLDYETAALIRERFGLVGAETKALFLRGKTGRFIMFVSQEGQ